MGYLETVFLPFYARNDFHDGNDRIVLLEPVFSHERGAIVFVLELHGHVDVARIGPVHPGGMGTYCTANKPLRGVDVVSGFFRGLLVKELPEYVVQHGFISLWLNTEQPTTAARCQLEDLRLEFVKALVDHQGGAAEGRYGDDGRIAVGNGNLAVIFEADGPRMRRIRLSLFVVLDELLKAVNDISELNQVFS